MRSRVCIAGVGDIFYRFPNVRSACSVAASYKPPMLVTRVRLPACADFCPIPGRGTSRAASLSLGFECCPRRAETPKKQSTKNNKKTPKPPKKGIQKKIAGSAKTLRFKGVGPKFRRRPGGQTPKKTKKKTAKKHQNPPKRGFKKKSQGLPKPCVLKGLARNFEKKAGGRKPPKRQKKKTKKNPKMPISFWAIFFLKPAAASCPPGKRKRTPNKPKTRRR